MYMAPIQRTAPPPSSPLFRRTIGVPVLALAALVGLPWLALHLAAAAVLLLARFLAEALDYAGQVALGR